MPRMEVGTPHLKAKPGPLTNNGKPITAGSSPRPTSALSLTRLAERDNLHL